jgi:hypothetical protein
LDYAYTIHGWLKGVNSNSLSEIHDMGKDGADNAAYPYQPGLSDLNKYTARAMSLR